MSLQGKTIVFTGTLSTPRAQATQMAEAAGAKVTASVTGNTNFLVCGPGSGKKMDDAVKKGVTVWTEDDFIKAVSGKAAKAKSPKSKKDDKIQKPDPAAKAAKTNTKGKTKAAEADSAPPAKKAKVDTKVKKADPPLAPVAKTAPQSTGAIPVDPHFVTNGKVYGDFSVTLNQTNIDANNNKFYIIQLVQEGTTYTLFTRWGRVGEPGSQELKAGLDIASGQQAFEKKFRDKSGNKWEARHNFEIKADKYQIVETETKPADDIPAPAAAKSKAKEPPSKLDANTQSLVSWILDKDMFSTSMAEFNIDVKKCPLGAITKNQVAKGFAVLKEIDAALQANNTDQLSTLSSQLYTLIPHSFSRNQRPPVINTQEMLRQKFDLVAMLGDIEIAQDLQKNANSMLNAIDEKYEQLHASLTPVTKTNKVFQVISNFMAATQDQQLEILDMWSVDRQNEGTRFSEHTKLDNRRLLWHGTNIAVVAAILKTGLRIMPTASSGSRVGRGIYLASEVGKSSSYCRTSVVNGKQHGILFLCEAPMGKMKMITEDDSSLQVAPAGFDSVIAKGRQEPDPSCDTFIELDKKKVLVPQGKPVPTGVQSRFSQSEYLVYKESQCRIRFILRVQFGK